MKRIQLIRAGGAAALLILGAFLNMPPWVHIPIMILAYGAAGYDTLYMAGRNVLGGHIFDENFLMSVATLGAIALGDYAEAVFVMLFYLIGIIFENYAVNQSRDSISALMKIRPDSATLLRDGREIIIDPGEAAVGDAILIKPGERVPLDGVVLEGASSLDTSALTGESLPADIAPGREIFSGCVNLSGLLKVEVTGKLEDSTVSRILKLVEDAQNQKAKVEKFITRFARYYTPAVVIAAVLLAVIPPLVLPGQHFAGWINRALIFLVVSCPCALVLSVPLAFFGGIGGASRQGILIKGSNDLEALSRGKTVVFGKTGTLTTGAFQVKKLYSTKQDEAGLLKLAAYAEHYSGHPIARSIQEAYQGTVDETLITDVAEIAGKGVRATINGKVVFAGNAALMKESGIWDLPGDESAALVRLAVAGEYYGYIAISDTIRGDAAQAVRRLKSAGVKEAVMLTGDREAVAENVCREIGLDRFYAGLLPGDKVAGIEAFMARAPKKETVVFVGDGINDAPVLARAHVGVAMGGLGSEAAIEAADVILMDDKPSKLAAAIQLAKKTMAIARQNVVFALLVKAMVLILGALGLTFLWVAVFADVGVTVIAVFNSMRTLRNGPVT